MPELRPLTEDHFPEVYSTFFASDDPSLGPDTYQPMFAPEVTGEAGPGYGLFSDGRLVGMLGTIVSHRTTNSRPEVVCNLHSWNVLPEFRGYSLLLMRPVLRRTDWTLTDLSPTAAVAAISARMGFRPRDGRLTLLFRSWKSDRPETECECLTDRQQVLDRTANADETIRAALRDASLTPLMIRDADGECLMLGRRVERHCRPYVHLHSLSDAACFARWSLLARRTLLELCGGSFVAVERHLLGSHRVPFSMTLPVSSRQLVRPGSGTSGLSDTLRSELQFVGMTTLPEKRLYLEALAERMPRLRFRRPSTQPA